MGPGGGGDCEINTVSARMTESAQICDGKKINSLKAQSKLKLQCRAPGPLPLWIPTVLPVGRQNAWYRGIRYRPVMNSFYSHEPLYVIIHVLSPRCHVIITL